MPATLHVSSARRALLGHTHRDQRDPARYERGAPENHVRRRWLGRYVRTVLDANCPVIPVPDEINNPSTVADSAAVTAAADKNRPSYSCPQK